MRPDRGDAMKKAVPQDVRARYLEALLERPEGRSRESEGGDPGRAQGRAGPRGEPAARRRHRAAASRLRDGGKPPPQGPGALPAEHRREATARGRLPRRWADGQGRRGAGGGAQARSGRPGPAAPARRGGGCRRRLPEGLAILRAGRRARQGQRGAAHAARAGSVRDRRRGPGLQGPRRRVGHGPRPVPVRRCARPRSRAAARVRPGAGGRGEARAEAADQSAHLQSRARSTSPRATGRTPVRASRRRSS